MALGSVTIDPMAKLTISVRFRRAFRLRLWLSAKVIAVAALIAGCDAEVLLIDEDQGVTRL